MAFFGGAWAVCDFVPLAELGCSFLEAWQALLGPPLGRNGVESSQKLAPRAADPVMEERPAFNIPPLASNLHSRRRSNLTRNLTSAAQVSPILTPTPITLTT